MLPALSYTARNTNLKEKQESYLKITAQNTAKMVQLLSFLIKSNEQINKKTDKLIQISNNISNSSSNMLRYSEEISKNTSQGLRYSKRLEKRLTGISQKIQNQRYNNTGTNFYLANNDLKTSTDNKNSAHDRTPIMVKKSENQIQRLKDVNKLNQSQIQIKRQQQLTISKQFSLISKEFNLMRKQLAEQISKTQVDSNNLIIQYQDIKKILNPSEQSQRIDMKKLKFSISRWVGKMYRSITDQTYRKYSSKLFNEDQSRLYFCQSLILNHLEVINCMRQNNIDFWNKNRSQIIQYMKQSQKKILKFLKTKFPRNKQKFKSLQFQREIQKVNNSQDPRYDIIKNTGIQFKTSLTQQILLMKKNSHNHSSQLNHSPKVHYIKQIKIFINKLIVQVEKHYPQFHEQMKAIFILNKNEKVQKNNYLIGKKFKDNIPLFSDEQLDKFDFHCKSPQILRIIIKWLEQIEEIIQKPQQTIMNKKAFKNFKISNKQSVPASETIRKSIIHKIQTEIKNYDKQIQNRKQILTNLLDNISELVESKPDNIQFLKQQDVKTIKFSQLVSQSIPFFAIEKIQLIINIFRSFQNQEGSTYSKLLQQIDLLTFSVFDLLRSRCTGSKDQIIQIFRRIKQSKYFELIRVKNRLDTPLNDILINCKINNSLLICEVQLSITNQHFDERSLINDHFNHFLYQLERSRFGPLCQASLIISDSDPRMQYTPQLRKVKMKLHTLSQAEKSKIQLEKQTKYCHNMHQITVLDSSLPFLCTICSSYNSQISLAFDSYECSACNLRICASCYFERLNEQRRKEIYFKYNDNSKALYKETYYELRNFITTHMTLQKIIKQILIKQNSKYCVLIRYSNSTVSRKVFKLVDKIVCPVYFFIKNQIEINNKFQKYDTIFILNQKNFSIKSIKQIKTYKEIEILNTDLERAVIQTTTIQLKKNLITIVDQQKVILIDFDEGQEDQKFIKKKLQTTKIKKIIRQCSITKNTTLDLSSRQLTQLSVISKQQIDQLKHILTVVADQNRIENLSVFLKLPSVKKISMKNNSVSTLNEINLPHNLVDLYLAYNKFTAFPEIKSINMTRISIKNNKIKDMINIEKSELPALLQLGLADNLIPYLPKLNLPKLQKLLMKSNKLKSIRNLQQSKIQNVSTMDFQDNEIAEIPKLTLKKLNKLLLKKNKITSLQVLKQCVFPELSVLNAANNSISQFPQMEFKHLKTLELSFNKIHNIQFLKAKYFRNIKQIILNDNLIQQLCEIDLQSLHVLSLKGNLISRLTYSNNVNNSFLNSNLSNMERLIIAENNKFYFQKIILREIKRVFRNIKLIT